MKPETRKLWNEGRLKMTNPMDHRCVDCNQPVPYSIEPCVKCRQYVCEKCSDPVEGICLACPNRAKEQENLKLPVTYELLARMIAESESRIRCDQREKRDAFEDRVQAQYRKELDQIREQVAELFKDLTPV